MLCCVEDNEKETSLHLFNTGNFFLNIFYLWLVECTDAKTMDMMKGQLELFCK
jgi:hypothetical protein